MGDHFGRARRFPFWGLLTSFYCFSPLGLLEYVIITSKPLKQPHGWPLSSFPVTDRTIDLFWLSKHTKMAFWAKPLCRNIKHQTEFSSPGLLPYLSKPLISLRFCTFSRLEAVRVPAKSGSARAFHAFLCQCEENGPRARRCNTDSQS